MSETKPDYDKVVYQVPIYGFPGSPVHRMQAYVDHRVLLEVIQDIDRRLTDLEKQAKQ